MECWVWKGKTGELQTITYSVSFKHLLNLWLGTIRDQSFQNMCPFGALYYLFKIQPTYFEWLLQTCIMNTSHKIGFDLFMFGYGLGTTSKPNRQLTTGSGRFSIVLNNDSRPEPDGTGGRPAVGFWSRPLWAKEFATKTLLLLIARIKGHLEPTHLKSSPLFTLSTKLLVRIHHQFTSFLK